MTHKTVGSVWEQLSPSDREQLLFIVRSYTGRGIDFPLGALPFIKLDELRHLVAEWDYNGIRHWKKQYGASVLEGALVIERLMKGVT